jgi:hypothetical protein
VSTKGVWRVPIRANPSIISVFPCLEDDDTTTSICEAELGRKLRGPLIWFMLKTDFGGGRILVEDLKLKLAYTLLCDDVRLEMGNKLSYMGVFQSIMVQQLPVSLIKFAVVNHWVGEGAYLSEVRILTPDRSQPVVVSQPTQFELGGGGFADNISFFVNVAFPVAGEYWVQTLVNSSLFNELRLTVTDAHQRPAESVSEAVN